MTALEIGGYRRNCANLRAVYPVDVIGERGRRLRLTRRELAAELGAASIPACTCLASELERWGCCCPAKGARRG
jgi:hypothetical protein